MNRHQGNPIFNPYPIKQLLKRLLTGLSFSQEYLCLDKTEFESPLFVSFTIDGNNFEITDRLLFLGYKPLILGIVVDKDNAAEKFLRTQVELQLNFNSSSEHKIAELVVMKFNQLELDHQSVFFFEGNRGYHRFIDPLFQWINRQIEVVKKRKLSDADLSGNEYDQVRIAYSIPRTISVVTVCDGDNINMFPTDLHGPAGPDFYISSLRINGRANSQVEAYKKIVLSEVAASRFNIVYGLGKNHMKDLRNAREFETESVVSSKFRYLLPKGTTTYRELHQIRSFDCGIHRIHVYQVEHVEKFGLDKSVLGHIHHYYGQWRVDNNLKTDFLIR